jgi:hypothetical protein
MFRRRTVAKDEQAAKCLAVRICRELYRLSEKKGHSWLPLQPIVYRLDADFENTFAALKYAVRMRWLNSRGNPANVMLLRRGRSMFADANVARREAEEGSHV